MEHKYSTYAIIFTIVVITIIATVEAIDGYGTTNYIPKFTSGGVLNNSNIQDTGVKIIIGLNNIQLTKNNTRIDSNSTVTFNSTTYSNDGNVSIWRFISSGKTAKICLLSLQDGLNHTGGDMCMYSTDWGSTGLQFGANNIKPAGGYWIFYDASTYGFLIQNQNSPYENRFVVNKTDTINYINFTVGTNTTNNNLKVYANDNRSQKMCLNVSQTGTVSAFKC